MEKIRVAVIFGGRSAEHEVSLQSAGNIIQSLDKNKYEPVLIGIDRNGRWFLNERAIGLLNEHNPKLIQLNGTGKEVALTPTGEGSKLIGLDDGQQVAAIDVIFPVLHGPYGEDGTIQGLAKLADLPCVGPGILGSAVGMDKDVMKRLLRDAGIDNARFVALRTGSGIKADYGSLVDELGQVLFVKPANLGSSVGISRVLDERSFERALEEAFRYDTKVIVEEEIKGREIECAVLGNDFPEASALGEIIPQEGFYSYTAKYINDKGALLEIPAKVTEEAEWRLKETALKTYEVLECQGMARVDMFLTNDGKILVNEINTIPGFTRISMYPKLWEYAGLSQPQLVDRLIELAIENFDRRSRLKVTVE